jgi:small subunit ribosomal protein S21
MVEVRVRDGEGIEDALRRFKREVEKEGILRLVRERRYYKPASVLKKEKNSAIKRRLELKQKRKALKAARPRKGKGPRRFGGRGPRPPYAGHGAAQHQQAAAAPATPVAPLQEPEVK